MNWLNQNMIYAVYPCLPLRNLCETLLHTNSRISVWRSHTSTIFSKDAKRCCTWAVPCSLKWSSQSLPSSSKSEAQTFWSWNAGLCLRESIYLSIYLPIDLSIYRSIYLYIYIFIFTFIYILCMCMHVYIYIQKIKNIIWNMCTLIHTIYCNIS